MVTYNNEKTFGSHHNTETMELWVDRVRKTSGSIIITCYSVTTGVFTAPKKTLNLKSFTAGFACILYCYITAF